MKRIHAFVLMMTCVLAAPGVQAAMAVVDIRAIAQMRSQLQSMQNQLTTARNQLTQAQQQYQSMIGSRGMERLLAGTARNYLPPDWAALEATLRGAQSSYAALTRQMDAALRGNAVLTPAQTAHLTADQREQLEASRRSVALLQITSREALQNTSQRFTALQGLIDAIPSATDTKAALDLQARIAAHLPEDEDAQRGCDSMITLVGHYLIDEGLAISPVDATAGAARELRFRPCMGWLLLR